MGSGAVSGILIDSIRLSINVEQNHTKYVHYGMPSTYTARISFLYMAVSLLGILYQGVIGKRTKQINSWKERFLLQLMPWLSIFLGVVLVIFTTIRYNFTGSLWQYLTFGLIHSINAKYWYSNKEHNFTERILHHQFNMISCASFGWWGAGQSFLLGIIEAITGISDSPSVYTGNQWRETSITEMLSFLGFWLAFFVPGIILWIWFRRKRLAGTKNADDLKNVSELIPSNYIQLSEEQVPMNEERVPMNEERVPMNEEPVSMSNN